MKIPRRFLSRFIAPAALLLFGSATATATWQEILTNGGFESSFSGWTQSAGQVETVDVYHGAKSAKITAGTYFKQFYQTIPFTPGRTLKGSGYLKVAGATGNHGITIQFLNSSSTVISGQEYGIGSATGTTGYVYKESAAVVSPTGTAFVRLRCQAGTNAGGTSQFDLISLQEDVPGGPSISFTDQQYTEQLINPGFESDWTSGWNQSKGQIDTANPRTGLKSAKLGANSSHKTFWYRQAAVAGEVFSASCWGKSVGLTSTASMSLRFMDASSSTPLKSFGLGTMRSDRPWRQYSYDNARAPVGTAYVEIIMSLVKENTAGAAYFDDFSLRKNTDLPIRVVPTFESVGVTVLTTSDTADCTIYYRAVGGSSWKSAIAPYFDGLDSGDRQFRCSISGLAPDTDYQAYAFIMEGSTVTSEGGVSFSTWKSNPPIAQTLTVASLYTAGTQLTLSNLQGSPTGWIKITGTGVNDVNGSYTADQAVLISNCAYVILENVNVTGGRRHGINIVNSDSIRVQNCDISGWARLPNIVSGGKSYETAADVTADNAINMDAGVNLVGSSQVVVERCYLHDPRLSANNWDYGHPEGAQGIIVSNAGSVGNHVLRYNDIIGSDKLRWNDGIESFTNDAVSTSRDTDIQGNMICYGQDDSVELDGGMENARFFDNKLVGFMCGMSTAPNLRGPSYIFRNLFTRLGDGRGAGSTGNLIKQGGGTTYSKGMSYYFNNTIYGGGYAGIAAVGYGSDANRDMYHGTTRNNIIYATSTSTFTIEDPWDMPDNSFDFDNLWNVGLASAKTDYAAGQEPNGTLNAPPVFIALADDDYRLATSSPGIDDGTLIPGFADTFSGIAPDQGAFEGPAAKLYPARPIAITANKYRVVLTATANGASSSSTVTLTTGNIGGATAYTVKKNASAGWINVTPISGTLSNNSTQTFTISVNTAGLTASVYARKGVFLVRLPNGFSVPIVVEATIN